MCLIDLIFTAIMALTALKIKIKFPVRTSRIEVKIYWPYTWPECGLTFFSSVCYCDIRPCVVCVDHSKTYFRVRFSLFLSLFENRFCCHFEIVDSLAVSRTPFGRNSLLMYYVCDTVPRDSMESTDTCGINTQWNCTLITNRTISKL